MGAEPVWRPPYKAAPASDSGLRSAQAHFVEKLRRGPTRDSGFLHSRFSVIVHQNHLRQIVLRQIVPPASDARQIVPRQIVRVRLCHPSND